MNKADAIKAAKEAGLTVTKEVACGKGTEFMVGEKRIHNEQGCKQTWKVEGKSVGGATVTDCIMSVLGVKTWCGRPWA
jgi:hypothetical protein